MKRRAIEFFKDVLIVVLVVAILILTIMALPTETLASTPWLAAVLRPFAGMFGMSQAELTYTQKAVPALDAAQPLAISMKNSAGRYSCQYDFSTLDSVYETLGSILAQALDTASAPAETTRSRLYAAIEAQSVTLRYPANVPVDVLSSWLGVQTQTLADISAELLVLSIQDGGVRLYLMGNDSFVAQTQVSADTLLSLLDSYRPDGSFFAFEDGSGLYQSAAPLSLVGTLAPEILAATAQNPCDSRFITALATQMGFNPYGDTSYTDSVGNAFFSETGCSLRISAAGELLFESSSDTRFSVPSQTASSMIEMARSLLEQLTVSAGGSARLYLTEFTQTDDGAYCAFDYILNGVSILQQQGTAHGASVTFTGSTITELTLQLRTYTLSSQILSVMPAAQAAAIVKPGTLLRICYDDAGTGELSAGWRAE